ncbi:MAG: hypothetical protein HXY40_13565 [Chloroflexi bacterium]|nr:hypothetical protein [Chloroflexota bacterium]
MRNLFWGKLALFTLPFALVFTAFTGILIYSGESMPLAWVVALQQGEGPVLYRPRYGNRDLTFKLLSTEARRPQILALGSSRVLQMRANYFVDRRVFYNAGGPAWALGRVDTFLRALPAAALPRVLLLGLDQPWFNPDFEAEDFAAEVSDFEEIFLVNRSVFQDMLAGIRPPDFAQLVARREAGFGGLALGMRAISDGHGFRNDGSEQYGDFLVAGFLSPQGERARHLEWLRAGERMYVAGASVSEGAAQQLAGLLTYCQEHGVTVVGFFPPLAPTLYAEMRAGGQHTYVGAASERLSALFGQFGYAFFDFSDGAAFGSDGDFFDGWHASERIYLQLYIAMAQAVPDLAAYSDVAALQQAVMATTDTFNVFGP